MEKIKTIGSWILTIYLIIGFVLSIYMDYELISVKGIWAHLWSSDGYGMYNIILWPFYI